MTELAAVASRAGATASGPVSTQDVVVVTGSSGFIDSALVQRLAPHFTVVGLDRETSPHPPAAAECVCIEVTSDDSVAAALKRLLRS